MSYSLKIKASALRDLKRIPKPDLERLVRVIDVLPENPFRGSALKGDLRGLRRIRVGNYRLVYEVQTGALIILVVRVAHRKDVYRG